MGRFWAGLARTGTPGSGGDVAPRVKQWPAVGEAGARRGVVFHPGGIEVEADMGRAAGACELWDDVHARSIAAGGRVSR